MFKHNSGRCDVMCGTNMMIYFRQLLCHIIQFVLTKAKSFLCLNR